MIRVTLTQIIVIYLCVILVALLAIWWVLDSRRKRREARARRFTVICSICSAVYDDPSDQTLSKCPECGSMNERERVRDI